MGMQIFEKNGTFNPADWGLGVGDMVQVVCVGGGCSGDGVNGTGSDAEKIDGKLGTDSKFGNHVSSANGRIIGYGGQGYNEYSTGSNSITNVAYGGGGAGGYLPGIPMIGGNGGSMNQPIPSGLGGAFRDESQLFSMYCNTYGAGNCGAGIGNAYAEKIYYNGTGGNGYGAGGGGSAYRTSRGGASGKGGNSGKFIIGTVKLTSSDPISVTVGTGGASVGTNESSGKGADGVVVVTW